MFKDIEIKSHIDTIQTSEPEFNREDNINTKGVKWYIGQNKIRTIYSLNNFDKDYKINESFSETIIKLDQIMNKLRIKDISQCNYRRVDVASDIMYEFNDMKKMLYFLYKCISMATNLDGQFKEFSNMVTKRFESYIFKSNYINIEFYDKKAQSKGAAPYPTRLEVRLLRRKTKDLKKDVMNVMKLWKKSLEMLEKAENEILKELKDVYKAELDSGEIHNFHSFVDNYRDYFVTRYITQEMYRYSGHSGNFKRWLELHRRNYNLKFINKTDVKLLINKIIKSTIYDAKIIKSKMLF